MCVCGPGHLSYSFPERGTECECSRHAQSVVRGQDPEAAFSMFSLENDSVRGMGTRSSGLAHNAKGFKEFAKVGSDIEISRVLTVSLAEIK